MFAHLFGWQRSYPRKSDPKLPPKVLTDRCLLCSVQVPMFVFGILLLLFGLYFLLPVKDGAQETDVSGYRHALSGRREAANANAGDAEGISVPDLEAVPSARVTSYSVERSTGLLSSHGSVASRDLHTAGGMDSDGASPALSSEKGEVLPTELVEADQDPVAESRRRQESAAARPSYNAAL